MIACRQIIAHGGARERGREGSNCSVLKTAVRPRCSISMYKYVRVRNYADLYTSVAHNTHKRKHVCIRVCNEHVCLRVYAEHACIRVVHCCPLP